MKRIHTVLFIITTCILFSCSTENTPVYQLTTSVNPAEAGSVSPTEGEYDEGTEVSITATPNEGWVFDHWQGDLNGSENPQNLTMDSDKDITAFFTKKTYPLTVTVEGEGTVQETVVQEKSTDYEHGTLVKLTAEPSEGWHFVEWTGSTNSVENPMTLTVENPTDITAVFERNLYNVEIQTEGEGSVEITIISGQKQEDKYEHGTVIELLAQPAEDWIFIQWELDKQSENNPVEVIVDDDKTIRALFGGTNTFYLAENGVTIKCPTAEVGEKGVVDGVEYEAVDRGLLRQRIIEEADLSKVCTSLVTDTDYIFENSTSFNQPIGNWDVSNVTTMQGMFLNARSFNQPIADWDVSNVTTMYRTFGYAYSFNQPIGNWDVSNVTSMLSMFGAATSFNQPIGEWDVSNVIDMIGLFDTASSFNQPLEDWDVSNVKSMADMFYGTRSFNQDLTGWCVSNIPSEPQNFAKESALEEENKPIWGTCPE